MIHERLDLDHWVKRFPLAGVNKKTDIATALTGPVPVAYVEQIRSEVKRAGGDLGPPVPVDLCVWNLGDAPRREATKIGGAPYWPADEPWPMSSGGNPYTFVAQFCFADSMDILPDLPGDILSIFAAESDYQTIDYYWLELGDGDLLSPDEIPAPRWAIEPCHAVLHRTAEYPHADYELFEQYPYPLSLWARRLNGSKIGGSWVIRGELPDLVDIEDDQYRKDIEKAWERVRAQERTFICQLESVQATARQPFVNVESNQDRALSDAGRFLMIADVGGYEFFFDGKTTDYEMWCG